MVIKPRAAVYDLIPSGVKSNLKKLVEDGYDYKVIGEYIENKEVVSKTGQMPKLSELLTDILRGNLKIDALFVRSIEVFNNVDILLGIKRLLELRDVKLISLKSKERILTEKTISDLNKKIKHDKIRDGATFGVIFGSGTIICIMMPDPFFIGLVIGTILLFMYFYYKKTIRGRRRLEKKIKELLSIDIPKSKKVIVKASTFKLEIIEE
jgi:hypothetical protein